MGGSDSTDEGGKRVKIFTVHGTFAHEAAWDNWDADDSPDKPDDQRHFVNRLSGYLNQHGVRFEQADHTEFNWSGGNSHDERRTAAIALKKKIQDVLRAKERETGQSYKEYYKGGVFVIGHSHGGTLSRLAINLWDRGDDYYDPSADHADGLLHDDKCPHCRQRRNLEVAPNEIERPDGVITFGSPFVHFRKRKSPLAAARLFAWSAKIIGILIVIGYYIGRPVFRFLSQASNSAGEQVEKPTGGAGPTNPELAVGSDQSASLLTHIQNFLAWEPVAAFISIAWPLALFWLFALYIPGRLRLWIERRFGTKGAMQFFSRGLASAIWLAGVALLFVYFVDHFSGGATGAWKGMMGLVGAGAIKWFWWLFPLILYWLLALSLPNRLLQTLNTRVEHLGDELPKKYDPDEPADLTTRYLSYHTPGDEAGLHLRIFGIITWIVQTLWLAAGAVLLAGLVGMLVMFAARALGLHAEVWNGLFGLPVHAWNLLFFWMPAWQFELLEPQHAWSIPWVLALGMVLILGWIMPLVLLGIATTYFVSMWLRGSDLVFGSERISWTMAASIAASPRPSDNAKLKRVTIFPQAWWNGEMAHCYFYKYGKVIEDVARHIAGWPDMAQPNRDWKIRATLAHALQALVVLLAVMSLFVVTTDNANQPAKTSAGPAAKQAPAVPPPPAAIAED